MTLYLERIAYLDEGVFGIFTLPSGRRLYTVERPWLDNTVQRSCIPDGQYNIRFAMYHRGGYMAYSLLDVPGRSQIKIHVANYVRDVIGCIGLGTGLNLCRLIVTNSNRAFGQFMAEMNMRDADLIIYPRTATVA